MAQAFSAEQVAGLLPHRGHALFVASAEVDGDTVRGECVWQREHPHLDGHFPQMPIVPGVFLIEAGAQLAGVLIAARHPGERGLGMLAGVRRTLVHRPVLPGDRIHFELDVRANPGGMFDAKGTGRFADGGKAVTLDLMVAVRAPAD